MHTTEKMNEPDFFEKLISARKRDLDLAEPAEGHFERFEERLRKEKFRRIFTPGNLLKIAAAVVFVFLAVNQTMIWISPIQKQQVRLTNISPQYAEVEFYYTNAIASGLEDLKTLNRNGIISGNEYEVMEKEFTDFEIMYHNLQKELKANPDDERVINAMIGYYQTKLNAINLIVNKLQEVNQKNRESHEAEM